MCGVCRMWVPMLGGSHTDQEMEGDGGPQDFPALHASRDGMQGVLR